jgi:hypothetical protein
VQDAGADRGISYGVPFGQDFLPSYPETTVYISPMFLKLLTRPPVPAQLRRATGKSRFNYLPAT